MEKVARKKSTKVRRSEDPHHVKATTAGKQPAKVQHPRQPKPGLKKTHRKPSPQGKGILARVGKHLCKLFKTLDRILEHLPVVERHLFQVVVFVLTMYALWSFIAWKVGM